MRFPLKIFDASRYQGVIDWDKVKDEGWDGAILKTVSTNYTEFGGLYIDPTFERNYAGAKRVGIPVGAYYYTYAQDLGYAKKELALFKKAVSGKQFELPLVVDVEDNKLKPLSADALTDLVEYAVKEIESWGCYAMVYTYLNYQNTELNMDRLSKYDLWLAAYRDNRPAYPPHSIWQYTSKGRVKGINGNVDLNWAYPINGKSHEEIIKGAGLNGWVGWTATDKYLDVISGRCEFFNSTDVNDIVGKLAQGTIYECTEISDRPIGGFIWVKFKMTDGEYYAVILEDRSRLIDKPALCEDCVALQAEVDKLKESVEQLDQVNSELTAEMTEAKVEAAQLKEENRKLNEILTDIENLVQEVRK